MQARRYFISFYKVKHKGDIAMKTINFTCLLTMYYNAMWAAEIWNANGVTTETLRYWKIANRLAKAMNNYHSNEFKTTTV